MTHLLNGAFYQFLIQFCAILFPHDPATFDWIPFPARIQLALLLDRANAAVIRMMEQRMFGAKAVSRFPDEQERFNLCAQRLKQEYQDAEQRRKSDAEHGKLTPPEPDLEYWQQVCEKEMYEARKAEGEPVQFVDGHLCIDAKSKVPSHKIPCGRFTARGRKYPCLRPEKRQELVCAVVGP